MARETQPRPEEVAAEHTTPPREWALPNSTFASRRAASGGATERAPKRYLRAGENHDNGDDVSITRRTDRRG